ncbi:MAG: efflux RND transporter permease subunit, partial [Pseudomonadota bacterium]|nr:efflux RND transporter permease subunit [Pseudomonadota bacterium]
AITLATGANALATADAVKSRMTELQATLPDSVNVIYPFETTPFIELSIKSVVKTLIEAVLLVFLVMYLFLQSFRATLVPTIMVPIVVLGTFGILSILGFTINTLTMFAMVLAIGLLVDDAIVVVENVERVMEEEGLSAFEASKQSIQQISGALIGIAMVLAAVFVPMAFFPGSAGKIYQQFSAAIVSAMVLSVILALILAPTLCAVLLKPKKEDHQPNAFFRWFNRVFDTGRDAYKGSVGFVASRSIWALLLYFILLALLAFKFMNLPTSFLPQEDQGNMFLILSAPPGSSAEVTMETIKKVEDHFLENEKETVEHLFTVVGFSFIGNSQNAGLGFVGLKDWDKRTGDGQDAQSIANRAMGAFSQFKEAMVFAITPPPINELGNSSGFDMQLIDLDREGHKALMAARNQLLGMASQNPSLVGVRPNGLEDEPQYQIDIDQNKAQALGLSLSDINDTLRIAWGSSYVNDFNDKGRIKAVYIQADAPYRMNADDLDLWYVRNSSGEMIPFSSFASGYWTYGSPKLERFNGYSSVNVQGSAAPGLSSGDAMDAMQELVKQLPGNYGLQWTGLSYEEQQSGDFSFALYALTVLVVFLSLAALYESWSIPFVVILAVPVGIIGAVIAAGLFDKANDIYFQVAILTAIGISAKNAILIVEFAKEHVENEGKSPLEATLEAASQRFRPIIMTSLAFMLGVTPLALASGAGSGAQNAIGLTVIGGMLTATFLAIFFVPLFFLLIMRLRKPKDKEPEHSSETEHTHV